MQVPPVVMGIGGHDPSSGAGIQADVLTIRSLGCHPVTVLTAVTVQNSAGVLRYEICDQDLILSQAKALIQDSPVSAIKTGMLADAATVGTVQSILDLAQGVPLIVDPVLSANLGQELSRPGLIEAIRDGLLPRALLATPNTDEVKALGDDQNIMIAVENMLTAGCENVLVTGTHDRQTEDVIHRLFRKNTEPLQYAYPRLAGEYHGSGCTLASAVAAYLSIGGTTEDAVQRALDYTWSSLKGAYSAGPGQLFPDRVTR